MSLDDDIKQAMLENLQGPRSVTSDGVTVQRHSLTDQIALAKYLASLEASKNPARAMMRFRIVAPGTVNR
jgi:hypothetical protein